MFPVSLPFGGTFDKGLAKGNKRYQVPKFTPHAL